MLKSKIMFILMALMMSSISSYSELPFIHNSEHSLSDYEFLKFKEHANQRLPIYIDHFKKYSGIYDIPWELIAAVAYQESKWDHSAVSYTGVRGLMQITEKTALRLGIEDRRNPYENIKGGAFYLKYLFDKTSPRLTSLQRWSHALAAYNIGWGHYRDAYKLAKKLNTNPYKWDEFKTILPKLADQTYYADLKHGAARGNETVVFVESVMNYYKLINNSYSYSNENFQL